MHRKNPPSLEGLPAVQLTAKVEMQTIHAGKRPWEPGGDDDMVCAFDVRDELDECNACVNGCEGEYADEVTGVTLLRDDAAKARMEEMSWCDKFKAHEEVTDETSVISTGSKPFSCRWRDVNKGDSERAEVQHRLVAREVKTSRHSQQLRRNPHR